MTEQRLRRFVLIGDETSKGTAFLKKAAGELGYPFEFIPIPYGKAVEQFDVRQLQGCVVKLDPPRFQTADILEVNHLLGSYERLLNKLEQAKAVELLNSPQAIRNTLNKHKCKMILTAAGVAVTPVLAVNIDHLATLKQLMTERKKYRVFIKPIYGSGAGGVLAYQINPRTGREVLYTSAYAEGNTLINTKKLRRFDDPETIERIGSRILGAGAVVEEWMQKARHGNKSYDLRVVYQFGWIEYMIARQSAGPITNLHLNNDALSVAELKLTGEQVVKIDQLCRQAVEQFEGLRVAGIDILLTPETLTPYIIEINAQGDLIYQDIYDQNRIYQAQMTYIQNYMQEHFDGRQE